MEKDEYNILVRPKWLEKEPHQGVDFDVDGIAAHAFVPSAFIPSKGNEVYLCFGWGDIEVNGEKMKAGYNLKTGEIVIEWQGLKAPVGRPADVDVVVKNLGLSKMQYIPQLLEVLGEKNRYVASAVGKTMGNMDIFKISTGNFVVLRPDGTIEEVRDSETLIERIEKADICEADRAYLLSLYRGKSEKRKMVEW